MELTGLSLIAGSRGSGNGSAFQAVNPLTGESLAPPFHPAASAEIDAAAQAASEAFRSYSRTDGRTRAAFLRRAADLLDASAPALIERAQLETALPTPRLTGEVARTSGQLRLFAAVAEEGSWVEARIDPALPDRKPAPRPDLRSMLRPLGPVAVFGASNFPFAFSVAGGDTASALAAGCPVIVKAHAAHPGASEMTGQILAQAARDEGLHPGVFSLLFDRGIVAGTALVQHPLVRAVAFTGSLGGGRALMDLAAGRPDPIPCFAEMASGNPVFILPGALARGPEDLARGLFGSFTLGAGQMCTKPGVVLLPETSATAPFLSQLETLVREAPPFTMLTGGIAREYRRATDARSACVTVAAAARTPAGESAAHQTAAQLFATDLDNLLRNPSLADEIFGPDTLLVRSATSAGYLAAAAALSGHLTASVFGTEADLMEHRELIAILEQKAGRLIFNGFPTGVEVCHAMVHGGPYPSASDPRFTSVGSLAIYRFARPVCFQGFPDALLPPELQESNPLGIRRLREGRPEPIAAAVA